MDKIRDRLKLAEQHAKGETSNVYADLGMPDAEGNGEGNRREIAGNRGLSPIVPPDCPPEIMGIPQPKVSALLRGQFRGISEAKMLEATARLGSEVKIVIGSSRRRSSPGHVELDIV